MNSPAVVDAVAALATRGNTLFLIYSTSTSTIGTLFSFFPASGTSGGNANNKNALVGMPQTITFSDPLPVSASQTIVSSSMVSSAIVDTSAGTPGSQQYHLYIALNTATQPFLVRLAPQSPNIGDGQDVSNGTPKSSKWSLIDQSQTLNLQSGISRAWLTSGLANGTMTPLEGSAIFEMLTAGDVALIQKLDVSDQPLGVPVSPSWPLSLRFLNNDANPKIVRLFDDNSGKNYEAFMIGACRTVPGTCILLIDNKAGITPITTTMMYDPTSCISAANGLVIMASTSGVWTFPYTGTGLTWTNRQPPSFAPNPSSSILTCATLGTKLYAVSQGNSGGVPAVFSIDMSSAQWDWQRVQLVTTSGSNLTSVPTPSSGRGDSSTGGASKGKLSSGAIAAIVVVVILAILAVAFGFYWRRKRNQKKGLDTMEMEKGVPPATVTVSPPPLSPAATVSANYSSVYPPRPNPAGNVPITGPLHPVVARDWSDGSMISNTSHPQPQQQQQPYGHAAHPSTQGVMPVESTTITTVGMPSMYAPTSPTLMTSPVRTQIIAGDKQELGHDEDVSSYMTPTPTSGSFLQPNAPVVSSPASGSSTAGPDPRLQGMMSPALANAQLILQQSQSSTSVNKRPDGNYR